MKWLSVVTVCVVAFLSNACEKHKATELDSEPHHGAEAPHVAPKDAVTNANPDKARQAEEAKPGEAPKFFPEKK